MSMTEHLGGFKLPQRTYPLSTQEAPPDDSPDPEWDDLPDADKVLVLEQDLKGAQAYIRGLEAIIAEQKRDIEEQKATIAQLRRNDDLHREACGIYQAKLAEISALLG